MFLAEHYLPDVSAERLDVLTRGFEAAAATVRREGRDVRFVGFAALPGDEACLSLLTAPSPEAVARAVEGAEVAADRIVPALRYGGEVSLWGRVVERRLYVPPYFRALVVEPGEPRARRIRAREGGAAA